MEPIQRSNREYFSARTARRLRRLKGAASVAATAVAVGLLAVYLARGRIHTTKTVTATTVATTTVSRSAAARRAASLTQQLDLSQRLPPVPTTKASTPGRPGHQKIRA